MKILFDQGTPAPLRKALNAHSVETANERGWSELQNGDLIAAAEAAGFEVFVTTDRNLKYQQNLTGRHLAIVVLLNHRTRYGRPAWPGLGYAVHCPSPGQAVLPHRAG